MNIMNIKNLAVTMYYPHIYLVAVKVTTRNLIILSCYKNHIRCTSVCWYFTHFYLYILKIKSKQLNTTALQTVHSTVAISVN